MTKMRINEKNMDRAVRTKVLGRVRKERMAARVRAQGFLSSADLAVEFGVSEMTIRRDLAELEAEGTVYRTHGGAVIEEVKSQTQDTREPFFDERSELNGGVKALIATAAAKLIGPSNSIALDVGTTTYALAQELSGRSDVRIFTNNLRIAALDESHLAQTYVVGGRVRQPEMSLCGSVAVQQLSKLWFDFAFIGVSSISTAGIFDYSIEETEVKRTYLERSTRKVVLADSSKFGGVSLVEIGSLRTIDTLVTDAEPPGDLSIALRTAGVHVIVADG